MARQQHNKRNISGILLLDKPSGITSNKALQKVKHLFRARKAGHTGSLDPLATGMLPICLGHATKVSSFLLDANKRYLIRAKLGEKTSTGDAEGEIIETSRVPELDQTAMQQVLDQFMGEIEKALANKPAAHPAKPLLESYSQRDCGSCSGRRHTAFAAVRR